LYRRYATADVFTTTQLSGNPVAVVLDAKGLTTAKMQALAAEFNYVETTFVLPPVDPAHDAHVRIFTPDREVPFAGHPTIGTAFLHARERARAGQIARDRLLFEQAAGLVAVDLIHDAGDVVGADVLAPQPLARSATVDRERTAACLGLDADDIRCAVHSPQVLSVGLPFLVVEVASRDALAHCRPDRGAYDALFPLDGAKAVYAYARGDEAVAAADGEIDVHARMFTWRLIEDPATGSAAAALAALLTELHGRSVALRIRQGEDMGRPSEIRSRGLLGDAGTQARVGGRCAAMFEGGFVLGDAPAAPATDAIGSTRRRRDRGKSPDGLFPLTSSLGRHRPVPG
jgi:trans-2,3-dihydro-3-hydroxyanthranilate isomerase